MAHTHSPMTIPHFVLKTMDIQVMPVTLLVPTTNS